MPYKFPFHSRLKTFSENIWPIPSHFFSVQRHFWEIPVNSAWVWGIISCSKFLGALDFSIFKGLDQC